MRRIMVLLLLLVLLIAVAVAGFASRPIADTGTSTVRVTQVDTSNYPEITLYVAATDEAGSPLTGLAADDFTIREDGAAVALDAFTGGGAASISTVLVVDRSGSMEDDDKIAGAREAAQTFVEQMRPGDVSALIAFSSNVQVLQEFTANQGALSNAIASLEADGGTALYDSIAAGVDLLAGQNGRRVLLVLTDGEDRSSMLDLADAIEIANTQGQPVYVVGLGERGFFGSIDEPVLELIAEETQGAYFYTPRADELAQLYANLAGGLQEEYSLTYISPRPFNDGTRRDIQVAIGSQTAAGAYTEQHLIKVSSNPLLGIALLLPLLGLLLLPDLARRRGWKRLNEEGSSNESPPLNSTENATALPASMTLGEDTQITEDRTCPSCGASLRPGARFCVSCGVGQLAAATVPARQIYCDQCGRPLRPGARFCNTCGASAPVPPLEQTK